MLQEGNPSNYVALIKTGEFEVIKQDMKDVDQRLIEFLTRVDKNKAMKAYVNLLRNKNTVYEKSSKLCCLF